jgi:hypothetical protein
VAVAEPLSGVTGPAWPLDGSPVVNSEQVVLRYPVHEPDRLGRKGLAGPVERRHETSVCGVVMAQSMFHMGADDGDVPLQTNTQQTIDP